MRLQTGTDNRTGVCMRLLVCLLTLSMLLLPGTAAAAEEQPAVPSHDEAEKIITDYWTEHESTAAGMAVAVFDADGVIYSNTFGYADKEQQIALDKDQAMDWGSVTKTLVWVSAMQLKEQGKLDLDRDIRDYLPEGFLRTLQFDTPVTMLHLMNHSAGFGTLLFEMETPDPNGIIPLGEFLRTYQPSQDFEPGLTIAYSNWGAALAGYIVECISGESFADYVHKHIFEPLGMEHSALLPDLSDNPAVAESRKLLKGYTRDGTNVPDCYRHIIAYPAGMCTSDLADFTTYARALADPDTILFSDKATYQELFTTTRCLGDTDIPTICHGFWQSIYGENIIGHSGNTSTCSSQLQFDPVTGVGMVVITNQLGEHVFCSDMTDLIMPEPDVEHHAGVTGTVMPLPTILHGPFKFCSVESLMDVEEEMFSNYLFARQTNDKIDRLDGAGVDYIVLSSGEVAAMYVPVLLWGAALLFAAVSLLVKLLRAIIRKVRGRDNTIPMGKWSGAGCLLIAASVLLLAAGVGGLSGEEMWSIDLFRIWSMSFLALGAVMALVLLAGLVRVFRESMTVRRRLYNLASVLMMAAAVYNIVHWELYTFWLL